MNFLKTLLAVDKVKTQLTHIFKMLTSLSRTLEEVKKDVEELKSNSRTLVFTKKQYSDIDDRVQYIEAFINNLEKIAFNDKDIAN